MMNNSELHGTLALVRPDLEDGSDRHKGQVGVLTYIDSDLKAYMSFPKGEEAIYEPYELLQLQEKEHLPGISRSGEKIDLKDYKDLYKIDLLQKLGRSTDLVAALEVAGANPDIWNRTLRSVESRLDLKPVMVFQR